jgi:5'-3' exonuclease, N-terminal resolvase-like domain
MIVHLVDGTYELFRHFYGLRRFTKGKDRSYGAVVGVLQTVLQMIDHVKGSASRGQGAAYLGVATDHVIESFRNRLWPDYKGKLRVRAYYRHKREAAGRELSVNRSINQNLLSFALCIIAYGSNSVHTFS